MIKAEVNDYVKLTAERIETETGTKPGHLDTYIAISKELKSFAPAVSGDVSDIFGGTAKNRIRGTMGHSDAYWRKTRPSTEAFAEMFSAKITNKESLDMLNKYLPKSMEIFEEMAKSIIGG